MAQANSADPDQTAPGAVWSGSTQFGIPLFLNKQLHKEQI